MISGTLALVNDTVAIAKIADEVAQGDSARAQVTKYENGSEDKHDYNKSDTYRWHAQDQLEGNTESTWKKATCVRGQQRTVYSSSTATLEKTTYGCETWSAGRAKKHVSSGRGTNKAGHTWSILKEEEGWNQECCYFIRSRDIPFQDFIFAATVVSPNGWHASRIFRIYLDLHMQRKWNCWRDAC